MERAVIACPGMPFPGSQARRMCNSPVLDNYPRNFLPPQEVMLRTWLLALLHCCSDPDLVEWTSRWPIDTPGPSPHENMYDAASTNISGTSEVVQSRSYHIICSEDMLGFWDRCRSVGGRLWEARYYHHSPCLACCPVLPCANSQQVSPSSAKLPGSVLCMAKSCSSREAGSGRMNVANLNVGCRKLLWQVQAWLSNDRSNSHRNDTEALATELGHWRHLKLDFAPALHGARCSPGCIFMLPPWSLHTEVVAGFEKCGTSSLSHNMARHPEAIASVILCGCLTAGTMWHVGVHEPKSIEERTCVDFPL